MGLAEESNKVQAVCVCVSGLRWGSACVYTRNKKLLVTRALLVAKTLLVAPGSTTRNKKLLAAPHSVKFP